MKISLRRDVACKVSTNNYSDERDIFAANQRRY